MSSFPRTSTSTPSGKRSYIDWPLKSTSSPNNKCVTASLSTRSCVLEPVFLEEARKTVTAFLENTPNYFLSAESAAIHLSVQDWASGRFAQVCAQQDSIQAKKKEKRRKFEETIAEAQSILDSHSSEQLLFTGLLEAATVFAEQKKYPEEPNNLKNNSRTPTQLSGSSTLAKLSNKFPRPCEVLKHSVHRRYSHTWGCHLSKVCQSWQEWDPLQQCCIFIISGLEEPYKPHFQFETQT